MIKVTIKKKDGEFKVTLWVDGKIDGTYFTNDKKDAEDTAKDMIKRREDKMK